MRGCASAHMFTLAPWGVGRGLLVWTPVELSMDARFLGDRAVQRNVHTGRLGANLQQQRRATDLGAELAHTLQTASCAASDPSADICCSFFTGGCTIFQVSWPAMHLPSARFWGGQKNRGCLFLCGLRICWLGTVTLQLCSLHPCRPGAVKFFGGDIGRLPNPSLH